MNPFLQRRIMDKPVPRLWLVIFTSLMFCLLLLNTDSLGFFRRSYQITSIINNFSIAFHSPKSETLNLTLMPSSSTQNDYRPNPAAKHPAEEKEIVSGDSQKPEIPNLIIEAGNATENEFKANPKEKDTVLGGSPESESVSLAVDTQNAIENDYKGNSDANRTMDDEEMVLIPFPKPETLNLTAEFVNASENKYKDPCAGRYVYVHDLPSKFNDDVIKKCQTLIKWFDMCPYMVNLGLGPQVIDKSKRVLYKTDSWFSTNQFLLEVIFREKMKHYKCLTNDSSLASAIYVPFYAGFDISRHLWGYNTTVRDKLGKELAKWLSEKPEWQKMYGRDHFFVAGRIGWDFRRFSDKESDWGNKLMLLPEFTNTTMLTIEKTSWSNEFAIPYPTYFHPTSKSELQKWQRKVRKLKRSFLFSFIGAPRPKMEQSIRGEIIRQCLASQGNCKFLNCAPQFKDCDNPVKVMQVFQDSVFCLQPQGDSATRRSVFDSILAGCIPVLFHPASAYTQYIWYLPKEYTKYSVYIPEEDVKNGEVSIEKLLFRFNRTEIQKMRNEVVKLIPKIIYSKPGSIRPEKIEDAFEIAVGKVFERVENVRRYIEEGKDLKDEFSKYRDLTKLE